MMVTMMVMMSIIVVVFLFAGTFDNQGNGLTNCDKVLLQQDVDRRWRLSRPPAEGRAESRQVARCESLPYSTIKVSLQKCRSPLADVDLASTSQHGATDAVYLRPKSKLKAWRPISESRM